jgi:hypothetical protein
MSEADYDTAEGLYDEIDGMRAMLAIREKQIADLMEVVRAAKAVTMRGGHAELCLLSHYGGCTCGWENALADLAALLDGEP